MESPKPLRTFKGWAFLVLGYVAIAAQAWNLFMFVRLIGK